MLFLSTEPLYLSVVISMFYFISYLIYAAFDEIKPEVDIRANNVICHGPRELTDDAIVVMYVA